MRRGVLIAGVVLIAFGLAMLSLYMLNSELNHETGVKRLNPNGQEGIRLPDLEKGDRIRIEFDSEENINVWISANRDLMMDRSAELIASNVSSGSHTITVEYSGTWYVTFQAGEEGTFVDYDIQVQGKFAQFSLVLGPVFLIFGAVVVVAGFRLEKPARDVISEIEAELETRSKGSKGKKKEEGGKKGSGKGTPPSKGKPAPGKGKPGPKGKPRPKKSAAEALFESGEEDTFDPEQKRDLPAWDAVDRAIAGEGKPQTEEDPTPAVEKPKPESPPRDEFSGWAEEEKPEEPAAEPEEEEVKSLPCVMCGGRMFRDARNEWVCDHCGNRI